MIDSNTVMSYHNGMNGKLHRHAIQALQTCLHLPNWLAIAVFCCRELPRRQPRWEARIRRQPPPTPSEKPRLRPRFSA